MPIRALINSLKLERRTWVYRLMAPRVCYISWIKLGEETQGTLVPEMGLLYQTNHEHLQVAVEMQQSRSRMLAGTAEGTRRYRVDWWMRKLIPNTKAWAEARRYNISNYLVPHGGCYEIHCFELDDSLNCFGCGNISERPQHVMFHCARFVSERKNLKKRERGAWGYKREEVLKLKVRETSS